MTMLVMTPDYHLVQTAPATITFYLADHAAINEFIWTNKQTWQWFGRTHPSYLDTTFYMASLAQDRVPFVLKFSRKVMNAVLADAKLYFGDKFVVHQRVDDVAACQVKV